MRHTARASLAVSFLLAVAVPAAAQDAPAVPERVSPEQVTQLVETLRERNEQVRTLMTRVSALEAEVAEARAATARLEAAERAIAIATQKNHELVEIAEAVITDYEEMDLGDRVAAGEPLTQLYRVRLENKLQDYRDQVAQQGFYPERDMPAPPAPQAQ